MSNLILVYVAALAILLIVSMLFSQTLKTRRFSMALMVVFGLLVIAGGVYLAFIPAWRTLAYLLLIAGGVIAIIAIIMMQVFKKRPPKPGKGPEPEPGKGPEPPKPEK